MAEHHWSGWPGAYCLHCRSEDPYENALALGWIHFDDAGWHFDTPAHEAEVKAAMVCPVEYSPTCGQCEPGNWRKGGES